MAEEEDFSQLSTEDKVTHKSWRARVLGYEEATKLFRRIDDEKSPEFGPYLNLLKKFVTDSNVVAQEKALEATLSLVGYAAGAPKVCGEVVPGLVAKAFNGRPKTKQLAFDICLTFIEVEKQDVVQEEVHAGLSNKQPKIVVACLELFTAALKEFGAKVMDVKKLMKTVPAQLEHKDKNVREAAKGLAVEMYRWLGPALKVSLEGSLKPVQMKEIEEECAKLPSAVAVPSRLLRSEQKKQALVSASAVGGGENEDEGEEGEEGVGAVEVEPIDPYDLLDPVDLLAQMPKDFYDNIAESKWSIRKEALESVLPLASKPKLSQGDYNELVKTLVKLITKDSNVLVVALAANVVKGLATGLREGFQPLVHQVLPGMLGKFKEKKMGVVTALREATDAVYLTTSFSAMEEDIVAALADKNPSVKAETALFLARCFQQCTPALMPKPLLKSYCPPLIQCLHDVPAVREAAAEALGTALKVVGERGMAAYLDGLESIKMTKVNEVRDRVELQPPRGVHAKASRKKAAEEAVPVKKSAKPKKEVKEEKEEEGSAEPPPKPKKKKVAKKAAKEEPKAASAAATESKPVSKPAAKKSGGASKPSGGGGKGKGKGGGGAGMGDAPDPPEAAIDDEEVAERAEALLPSSVRAGLASTKWQERLEAHEGIKKMVEEMAVEEVQSLLLVKILGMKPGWKETMFQVMKAKIAVVAVVAGRAKVFGRKTVAAVLPTIVDKLGDAKIKAQSSETLMAVAERMTLNYTSLQTLKHAFGQKNPKVQSESLEWLGQAVTEFGLLINIKPHVDYVNKAFESTNPAVRAAAVSLLGVMRMYVGAQLRVFFEDAKPALLQQIDAVFEKASDEAPPAPVRGPNCQTEEDEVEADDSEEGGAGGGAKAEEPQMSLADLMPKVDISPQITSSLVSELGDKNWKVRGEALQKVTDILAAAKFIEPSLGELPGALKGRLSDSNKNLITTTLNIMTTLANAMGSACGRHARTLLPGVFGALADAKPQLRAAAVATLNAWYDQIKLAPLVEAEIISTALATENPNLRSELLQWLAEKLPEAGKLPAEFPSIVPPLLSCLEDRSGEVRKHSQTVLPLVMARVGYEGMVRQTGKLKPASKQAILPLLEKHKASLPPPKSAKAKASSSAKEKTEAKEPSDSSPPAAAKETKTGKAGKTASKTGSKKGTGKKGKEAEEDFGPPLMKGPTMQQRQKDEQSFKVLKWSFSTPRSEFVEQLKDQMQSCVSRPLLTQLFHDDFKQHIAALGTLKECVSGSAPYEGEAIACLDLLLKWVTLRFCDTNTTVNLKCLEFLSSLFALLIKGRYRMSDFEAASFLPFLVIKSGDAKDAVRKEVRALFDQICCFYAPPKLFGYVAEGLKSKNSRQRFECLEMLGVLVQNNGLVVCQPSPQKAVQQIAPFVGEKDSSVRNAALNTLVIFYENMGEAVYKHVGRLPHKDLSMLEERIRRVAKKSSPETNTTITLQAKQVSPNPLGEGEGEEPPPQQRGGAKGGASRRRLALDPDATVTKEPEPEPEPEPDPPAPPPAEPEPEVAPPSTASPPKRSAIPVPSGPMRIDFSKYVYPTPPVLKLPRLPDHNMEELLADFEVPQYETSRLLANPPPSLTFSPNRMATTSAAISFIVSQIASSDQQSCVSALKQMEQILSKTEHTSTVRLHVDQLLRAVLMQMRMNFNTQLQQASSPENLKQVMALGKRLTSCLLNTFSQPDLASAASQDTLVETERDVMTLLQDERMLRLEDVAQLNRSFNYLMLKVIENGDKNALFGSLLHVMLESLGQDGNPSKLTEMVMKCLWKLTRQLAQILPQMSADQLLLDVHHFFTGYISLTAEGRVQDDTPFRTVKTILFHLVTIMGDSVLDHLTLVEDSRQSAMYKYLCKTIAKKRLSGEGVGPQIKNPTKEGVREGVSRVQPKRPPQLVIVDIPDELATPLANALDKMRDRSFETMREGFRELYALIETHPSFDFHAFVASNTLPPYQNYVKRGLKAVEYERQCIAENKKPLAETFQNMLYSDELRASKERYNVMKKQLEMEGVVLGRSNPTETSKENPGAAPGTKLTKKAVKPAPKVENPLAAARHSPPPGSSSDEPEGQDMSKFNLGSLMQRLNKLKGTS